MESILLAEKNITCPYCWQSIEVLIDCSVNEQEYTEDCQVCCRPIIFTVSVNEQQQPDVQVRSEEE